MRKRRTRSPKSRLLGSPVGPKAWFSHAHACIREHAAKDHKSNTPLALLFAFLLIIGVFSWKPNIGWTQTWHDSVASSTRFVFDAFMVFFIRGVTYLSVFLFLPIIKGLLIRKN